MGHCFSHLQLTDRRKIEYGLNRGDTPKQIAAELHVHVSTIYREIKRAVGSIWTAIHGLWKTAITRTERKKDTVKISRRKVRR